MKTLAILWFLTFLIHPSPDKLVDYDRVEILYDSSAGTTEYYYGNLQKLWDLPGRSTLTLKVATCELGHAGMSGADCETGTPGDQHVIAVALNGGGGVIETKVALPCPPHCEGGKLITTYDDFMASH